MLHTASFFNQSDHYGTLKSIAISMPPGFRYLSRIEPFVPEWRIVKGWKDRKINWEQYKQEYLSALHYKVNDNCLKSLRDYAESDSNHLTMLCWEKEPDLCHRSLVAYWLKDHDMKVVVK